MPKAVLSFPETKNLPSQKLKNNNRSTEWSERMQLWISFYFLFNSVLFFFSRFGDMIDWLPKDVHKELNGCDPMKKKNNEINNNSKKKKIIISKWIGFSDLCPIPIPIPIEIVCAKYEKTINTVILGLASAFLGFTFYCLRGGFIRPPFDLPRAAPFLKNCAWQWKIYGKVEIKNESISFSSRNRMDFRWVTSWKAGPDQTQRRVRFKLQRLKGKYLIICISCAWVRFNAVNWTTNVQSVKSKLIYNWKKKKIGEINYNLLWWLAKPRS